MLLVLCMGCNMGLPSPWAREGAYADMGRLHLPEKPSFGRLERPVRYLAVLPSCSACSYVRLATTREDLFRKADAFAVLDSASSARKLYPELCSSGKPIYCGDSCLDIHPMLWRFAAVRLHLNGELEVIDATPL